MANQSSTKKTRLSIVMAGDSTVGKTSLISSYGQGNLKEAPMCISTVGMDFILKEIEIDAKKITLHIWDTSGQERFHSVSPQYFRKAHGIVLVYDITRRESFNHLQHWLEDIEAYAPEDVAVILVGNKMDLDSRAIPREEGLKFAEENKLLFMETTACDGTAFSHTLEKLVRKILPRHVSYVEPEIVKLSDNSYDVAVTKERSCWEIMC